MKFTNADEEFFFTVINNITLDSSQISVPTEGGEGSGSGPFTMTIGDGFTITEDALPGYTVTSSDCTVNGTPIGTTFTPANLDIVLCTFTNTFS